MNFFERLLEPLARAQKRYGVIILIVFLAFTLFAAYGIKNIRLEGDMNKQMPQQLPIYQLNDRIRDKFAGQDTVFILLSIDEDLESKETPKDIRDPNILKYIVELEDSLLQESSVEGVVSLAPLMRSLQSASPTVTEDMVIAALEGAPALAGLINRDNKLTIMLVTADIGGGQEKTVAFENLIREKLKAYSSPAGVKIRFTGTPSIIVTIVTILGSDAIFTLILASIIILILLSVMQRSVTKGIVIFIPIFLGLIWTMGTLGWLDIAISFATAGLGAMILGLGVEYGIFMFTRYKEEKDRGLNQEEALLIAVPSIGSAVLGSGTTTIVGFLALTLSIMPMLQNLGLSLALGIFYCIISSLIIGPIIVIFEEDFEEWYNMHRFDKLSKKINKKNGERQ